MKQGRKPTRRQKLLLEKRKLQVKDWLVCKDLPGELVVEHRVTGTRRVVPKVGCQNAG